MKTVNIIGIGGGIIATGATRELALADMNSNANDPNIAQHIEAGDWEFAEVFPIPKPIRILPATVFILGTLALGAGVMMALVSLAIWLQG